MQTANDVLSYSGNVGLGLNSDGIAQYGDTDTRELNNSIFNLAYLNMQKNKAVWEQKIKDRDEAMALVRDGRLRVDNALPEDRKRLMGMLDGLKQKWLQHGGDLKSDPNVWVDFNDGLGKFKEAATIANTRFLDYHHGMAEAAKETRPLRREKMVEHWNSQLKRDLYDQFDPYQQQMDWDPAKVFTPMTDITATKRDGDFDVTSTRTDVAKSFTDYINRYQFDDKGETAPNIDAFYDNYLGIDGAKDLVSVGQSVNATNGKLKKIATDLGFNTDKPEELPVYLRPIRLLSQDPTTGKPGSADTKQVLAFKVALALGYKNVEDKKLNPNYSKIDKAKTDAAANMLRARAYADAQKANAGKAKAQTRAIKQNETPAQNYDELLTKTYSGKTENGNYVTRVNWDDLQANTRNFLGVQPLTAKNGQERFVNIAPTSIVDKKGNAISDSDAEKYYKQALDNGYKGSIIDYLKDTGVDFDMEVVGREGKNKKEVTRSGRLTSYQKQMDKKSKSNLFLEDDNTPDEVPE